MERLHDAFNHCLTALSQPGFAHIRGVGVSVAGEHLIGGPAPFAPANTFSVTKSIVALALTKALRCDLFAPITQHLTVNQMTHPPNLGDLLSMTQAWKAVPDMDAIELRSEDPLPALLASLQRGRCRGRYVNAGMHLLTRELNYRTGSADLFLKDAVFRPAGVTRPQWDVDSTGVPWGHSHLHLSVQSLLQIGDLILRSRQLEARREYLEVPIPPENLPYLNGFWIGRGYVMAAGWGGQCMIVVPDFDVVLVVLGETGWNRATNQHTLPPGWRTGRDLIERHLFPAIVQPAQT